MHMEHHFPSTPMAFQHIPILQWFAWINCIFSANQTYSYHKSEVRLDQTARDLGESKLAYTKFYWHCSISQGVITSGPMVAFPSDTRPENKVTGWEVEVHLKETNIFFFSVTQIRRFLSFIPETTSGVTAHAHLVIVIYRGPSIEGKQNGYPFWTPENTGQTKMGKIKIPICEGASLVLWRCGGWCHDSL